MECVFLGTHIDGVKFFYYYKSSSSNYVGYEVGSYFIPRNRSDLINQIRQVKPGSACILDMGFNGKKAIFNGIHIK